MKLLYCGDVVGKAGRKVINEHVPTLRAKLGLDFVIVNGENAAHGFGITPKICQGFYDVGVDCITTGNHAWDQKVLIDYIDGDPRLLRPLNFPEGTPGRGKQEYTLADGRKVLVVQAMGNLFMMETDPAFPAVQSAMLNTKLGGEYAAIVVDIHAEATSEKMAMGHFLDGKASLVVGTHSHVPTADAQILPGGTAYQTDAGMCGDYNSVIGMKKEAAIGRFMKDPTTGRLEPAGEEATLCAVYVETDDDSGLAVEVRALRIGGRLAAQTPV